jgi:hypothetical protein
LLINQLNQAANLFNGYLTVFIDHKVAETFSCDKAFNVSQEVEYCFGMKIIGTNESGVDFFEFGFFLHDLKEKL